MNYVPTLYCLAKTSTYINSTIKNKIQNAENIIQTDPDDITFVLNAMLVKNLIKLCKDNGIRGYSGKKKFNLIELIKNSGYSLPD
jgi:hypothetical protein